MFTALPVQSLLASARRLASKPVASLVLFGCLASVGSASALAQHAVYPASHSASTDTAGETVDIVAHVSNMLKLIQGNTEPSPAQKSKLSAIIQQANADLMPLQTRIHDGHAKMFSILTQPTIDRSAVEAARSAQIDVTVQMSKRSTQFMVDVAEALTPDQRKALAEHMSHRES